MIEHLNLKLNGKLPVTREELFTLINSWGRNDTYLDGVHFDVMYKKECYDLSKLDVSQIDNFRFLFRDSKFNGDISNWDVSNVTNMYLLFSGSNFNGNISNWNISKVTNMCEIFSYSQFNGDISNWNVINVLDMTHMFSFSSFNGDISNWQFNQNIRLNYFIFNNPSFESKYNNYEKLPITTKSFIQWFNENKMNIANANITKEEKLEIDDYLISFNNNCNKELKL